MASSRPARRPSSTTAALGVVAAALTTVAGTLLLVAAATAPAGTGSRSAPATPGAQEARRAALKELSRPVYNRTGILSRVWEWIISHLSPSAAVPGVPPWVSVLVVAVVGALLVSLLLPLLRRATVARRARRPGGSLFTDDRSSSALVQAADEAAARTDYATAVVERFRAIIRSLDEAGVIDEYPGMTASEAARAADAALGGEATGTGQADDGVGTAARLHEAARLFEAVLYGDVAPSPEEDTWMRALAQDVSRLSSDTLLSRLTPRPGTGTH